MTAKLQENEKSNFVINSIDQFREKVLFLPDRYITWYPFALEKATKILNSEHINAIYSTAYPLTPHLIAMKLKSQFKIPWVADFREQGVEDYRGGYMASKFRYKISSMLEKKIMGEADLILTIGEELADFFSSKYQDVVDNKVRHIRTGTDIEILQRSKPKEKSGKFTIMFTGEFLPAYSRKLFEFLKIIFERKLFERSKIEVLIVGSVKRNAFLNKEMELSGISDVVKVVDFISLNDYFGVLLSADATFLPNVIKHTLTIKLTDYLFAKKPIIIFDSTSEVREILEKSGLGFFIPSKNEDGIRALLNLLRGNYKFDLNNEYISQFTAFNQTKGLSDILAGLTEKNG